jgi:GntR family transcriptional regulator
VKDQLLDSTSPIPLYYQLKQFIIDQITSGALKAGDRVPSEAEIGEQFKVSRTTVRQAYSELVNLGFLTRMHGKGTFVSLPRIQQRLTSLTSFSQDMRARSQHPGARILRFETIPAPGNVATPLQITVGKPVIILRRLRLADDTPIAVETSYLVHDLCSGILNEDLENQSLYEMLSQKYQVIPTRALQALEATSSPAEEARLLQIRKGGPVLHIQRTTFNQNGVPFEQVESYYRGDRYLFFAELTHENI